MKENSEYFIPRCVVNARNGECVLPIVNTTGRDLHLNPRKILARGERCVQEQDVAGCSKENQDITFNIDDSLTKEERGEVLKLLEEFKESFSNALQDLKCTTAAELKIDLTDDKPVTYRPYRMTPANREKVKDMVKELLDCNIIRESSSPFSSPVVLVRKKNGKDRLCIDYRKLNSKIKQDRFPLPRMDEQIDSLQGYKYFTSIDMTSGYYQIPIEEESKNKTAFITPDGQYEFNRMPFGITTAPSVFQRMVNKILGPLRNTIAMAYLDDILIPSRDFKEGLTRLRTILNIVSEHNLTLNPEKCHFFRTKIDYLGFEISESGIRPGSDKTRSIAEFPTPKNVHQVRQFLGLTGFFRQFIQSYAVIAKPLTNLLKKNQKWKWECEESTAFETLKTKLTERPILALYDPNAEIEVHTDASQQGLAGMLLQRGPNKEWNPVAYYSRQTTPAESKYHSYELETLAVVETLKKFRVYLLDRQFKVVTDCNAVKAAAQKRDLIPRIARWWLSLQEFSFAVEYKPGTKLKHVDALSRNAIKVDPPESTETILRIEVADWVLAGQLTDEKIKLIWEILQKPPSTDYEKDIWREYCLKDGRIYKITKSGKRWLIPKGMRAQVVKMAHDDFGHFGVEKTLNKLSETYWFPNMKQYVSKYISTCIPCLFHKKPRGAKPGFLHPIEKVTTPFHTVHLDHLGPFVKSTLGKKYLIVAVESFTKYTFLRAVKDTKTVPVLRFLESIFATFGTPNRVITDKGTAYTSKAFQIFCKERGIVHIETAVATPRANGQVERFNSTILQALATTAKDDIHWDKEVEVVQFAINNAVHSITKKTPSEFLFGFRPRAPSDAMLTTEIQEHRPKVADLEISSEEVGQRIKNSQLKQKARYDRKRKRPINYRVGDLVLVRKNFSSEGQSKKLLPNYKGPFEVKRILPRDRFVIRELTGSVRRKRAPFENVEAVDNLKPYNPNLNTTSSEDETTDEDNGDDDNNIIRG